ncbi:hypothetical protein DFH06DRAFT_995101 [Mycena polygramma]|nr:hypothetical protein DFH06DRAFT_995101 [Mycena polygramma]
MQFLSILIVAIAALVSSTEGCKCVANDVSHPEATGPCCSSLSGDFNSGDGDCAADSISEHLSNFRSCCEGSGFTSDCDFP